MRKSLLLILLLISTLSTYAQKDTVYLRNKAKGGFNAEASALSLSIFPVPVRDNFFNIQSDKEFSSVKITNIIGQDIYREKFNDPQTFAKIVIDNPKRGMYMVTVIFSDGMRMVKKIMIEQSE